MIFTRFPMAFSDRPAHALRMGSRKREIDVFEYRNYRAFLRYFYQRGKANRTLSLRSFSQRAGLRSPNYLKLVIDGDRNLTPQVAARFAKACELSGEAADYFCDLVAFNQARSALERAKRNFNCWRRPLQDYHRSRCAYRSKYQTRIGRRIRVSRLDYRCQRASGWHRRCQRRAGFLLL